MDLKKQYVLLKHQIFQSLEEIIAIPSVISSPKPNKPFGEDIDLCLDITLNICQKLGFSIYKDHEGYYGYADIGEGEDLIGVLCHLDVVPIEDHSNWHSDPFILNQQNNKLIARGISDDKGPSIVCIYALKALLNTGFKLTKRIRFIFGTDEENLWRCINKYKTQEEIPSMGFTPDADFPVIHAEKGLVQFILRGSGETVSIQGGNSFNIVPANICYSGPKQKELHTALQNHNFSFQIQNNTTCIEGKSAHAQSSEQGINAISRLMVCLQAIDIHSPSIDFIAQMIDHFGEKLLGNIEDSISGKLKVNLAKVEIDQQESNLYFDFRIPVSYSIKEITEQVAKQANKFGFNLEIYDQLDPLYINDTHPLIQTLCSIYEEETGEKAIPISIGGATYSRAMKNFVSFGMNFPNTPKTAHQANEYISIEDLEKAFIIYAKAFAKLNNLPKTSLV